MDVVLEMMRVDSPAPDGDGKWRLGDVVYGREATSDLLIRIDGVCNVPRKCYLVLTDLPARITTIEEAMTTFEDMDWKDDLLQDRRQPTAKNDMPYATRRRWPMDFDSLTAAQKTALISSPYYLSMAWVDIENKGFKNRKTSAYIKGSDL